MNDVYWLEGPSTQKIRNQGYLVAGDKIKNELRKNGLSVKNTEYQDLDFNFINFGIAYELPEEGYDSKIFVNNVLPESYKRYENYSIGFTYWESNKLPKNWIKKMNQQNEIWTASNFHKNVFINSGIRVPVYSFNIGIDHTVYKPKIKKDNNEFVFIHDGLPSIRKNSQLVIDAFIKLFNGKKDFKLILKSIGPVSNQINLNGINLCSVYDHPQIEVCDKTLTDEENANLYAKADCMVYPTSGEGWGMMPFQAIAMGIPTICTNFSACEDYAYLSIPLDYHLVNDIYHSYSDNGKWAMPNFDDLCDKMLYVVNNYDEVKNKTLNGSKHIHSYYNWDIVGKEYYYRICQILKK